MNKQGKINVLHAIRQGQISGGEAHVFDLVTHLNTERYFPVVLSFSDGPMVDKLKEHKVPVYVIDTLKPFRFGTYSNVQSILRAENIDILHAHGTRAFSNCILPAKAFGIPLIYTVHGWAFHEDQHLPVKKARQLSEKLLIRNADLVTTTSRAQQKDGLLAINMKKANVVHYGVNLERFNPDTAPVIKNELGIPDNTTTVAYLARFNKGKDPFNFVDSVAYIKRRNCTNILFLMIGEGDLKEKTIAYANEQGVDDCIRFLPFHPDVPAVLNSIDIYCLSSQWERFPIGMLEAMAMRKAIVATAVNGVTDALKNDFNGLIVPPSDAEQLALAIMRLHFNEALRKELADRAWQTAHKSYNLTDAVREYEKIYQGFVQDKMTA